MRTQWMLRAFNVQTASLKHSTPQLNIAQLKLKWWKIAIKDTFKVISFYLYPNFSLHIQGQPPSHPILISLADELNAGVALSQTWFQQILNARVLLSQLIADGIRRVI